MVHDPDLLEKLSNLEVTHFNGEVFRATRENLDPLAASSNGGRWMPRNEMNVLYTSLTQDGAISELAYHWGMLNPRPSKPAKLSRIKADLPQSMRILRTDLESLGIHDHEYQQMNYEKMQKIGHASAFLDFHGLLVPSARWHCENLIIFTDNIMHLEALELIDDKEVDWVKWGEENNMLD
ncbi:MAG: RES family NAD+ phosphorylase [Candidatus Thiodiazotropha sp. (ex Codakia rugifera)]|nr:RES family NAD+ phosphorylase [Candidatus Thiodiazotropha sp. (ex Codakia rugifera)]